jgi:hypothetical protein
MKQIFQLQCILHYRSKKGKKKERKESVIKNRAMSKNSYNRILQAKAYTESIQQ